MGAALSAWQLGSLVQGSWIQAVGLCAGSQNPLNAPAVCGWPPTSVEVVHEALALVPAVSQCLLMDPV